MYSSSAWVTLFKFGEWVWRNGNGVEGQLATYLATHGLTHTRGKPYHPMTQGKNLTGTLTPALEAGVWRRVWKGVPARPLGESRGEHVSLPTSRPWRASQA